MHNILVTCPPMINRIDQYKFIFEKYNMNIFCPSFKQTLTENELISLLPKYDGWIIGDDPATRKVFEAGIQGKLKAAVKWGVGTDNVDFKACEDFNIPITNIPNVFGEEVSDIAIGYLISLTRQIHNIDLETKKGNWIKPCGTSLSNKKVCLIGFGDIGRNTARKLIAFNLDVYVSDPGFEQKDNGDIICKFDSNIVIDKEVSNKIKLKNLNECIANSDFIIVTCSLNKSTKNLVNKELVLKSKKGVRIINVARGPIVKQDDIIELLEEGYVDSVGFDVFEREPLDDEKLRSFKKCIFGSHNSSNTIEAVDRTSYKAIDHLNEYLKKKMSKI